jgi:transposase-like protein
MGGSAVGARYFEHRTRRAWWATHLEAWRRSGVTRTEYCRLHRLTKSTFDRWLNALNLLVSAREEARKRRKRTREPLSTDKRNKAVQAFWAMHVEALNWSGVSAKDYAAAHHISVYSLRTWRARLDADPLQIDWRARLHPSVRPTVSTSASDSAKEPPVENILTTAPAADPPTSGRKRRSFTDAEKRAIVLEAEQPGATVSQVARTHRIVTSVLFRWRAELGFGRGKPTTLAAVRIADEQRRGTDDASAELVVLQEMLPVPPGAMAVELADGRRVFALAGSDPEAVRQYVAERGENARC